MMSADSMALGPPHPSLLVPLVVQAATTAAGHSAANPALHTSAHRWDEACLRRWTQRRRPASASGCAGSSNPQPSLAGRLAPRGRHRSCVVELSKARCTYASICVSMCGTHAGTRAGTHTGTPARADAPQCVSVVRPPLRLRRQAQLGRAGAHRSHACAAS